MYRLCASGIQSLRGLLTALQLGYSAQPRSRTELRSLTTALDSVFIISASIFHPQKTREDLTATESAPVLTSGQYIF